MGTASSQTLDITQRAGLAGWEHIAHLYPLA
jgi:hypothetical protein